jgi:hypothetical protein
MDKQTGPKSVSHKPLPWVKELEFAPRCGFNTHTFIMELLHFWVITIVTHSFIKDENGMEAEWVIILWLGVKYIFGSKADCALLNLKLKNCEH